MPGGGSFLFRRLAHSKPDAGPRYTRGRTPPHRGPPVGELGERRPA